MTDTNLLPRYTCHKEVNAAKIKNIGAVNPENGTCKLALEAKDTTEVVTVTKEWLVKHEPQEGGYYVVYADGYASYSPAGAFEGGYREISQPRPDLSNSFGSAVMHLRSGKKMARAGWNGKGMFLALQVPDEHSKMQYPYIYMSTVEGKFVPWVASQTDLLAEDWVIVE